MLDLRRHHPDFRPASAELVARFTQLSRHHLLLPSTSGPRASHDSASGGEDADRTDRADRRARSL